MFCFCVHNTKQTVFIHIAVVFNVFLIWILFKIHQLYYRVFFLPWSKMHVFLLFGVAFLHSWLFNFISHIHFYMRTHLVCICFEFIFIWSCGGDVLFVNFYSDFLQRHIFFNVFVEKSFFFCNGLGNIIWHVTYLIPLSQGC